MRNNIFSILTLVGFITGCASKNFENKNITPSYYDEIMIYPSVKPSNVVNQGEIGLKYLFFYNFCKNSQLRQRFDLKMLIDSKFIDSFYPFDRFRIYYDENYELLKVDKIPSYIEMTNVYISDIRSCELFVKEINKGGLYLYGKYESSFCVVSNYNSKELIPTEMYSYYVFNKNRLVKPLHSYNIGEKLMAVRYTNYMHEDTISEKYIFFEEGFFDEPISHLLDNEDGCFVYDF
ncbi:MAG: hypothetical protein MJZ37_02085 [Bacilli bacterium]|nr:hypothetical protein [Bacilli bacterium]